MLVPESSASGAIGYLRTDRVIDNSMLTTGKYWPHPINLYAKAQSHRMKATKILVGAHNARKFILLAVAFAGPQVTPASSHAFSLGEFLNTFSGGSNTCNGRTCFNPGTTYSEWDFKEVRNGSTSANCKGIYERQAKYYAGGWQYRTQQTEGECPAYAINKLRENEAQGASERLGRCKNFIDNTYRQRVGEYVDAISKEICSSYSLTGNYSQGEADKLADRYAEAYAREEESKAVERERARSAAAYKYQTSLSLAQSKRSQINTSGQLRAFVVTEGGDRVYLHSFVIRSMDPGLTLGGSKVVDSNVRTELNGENLGERRIRIFCNEGRSSGIAAGSITYRDIPVTGEIGRWACGKYGFYHP